ncbi:unnamed protein product [Rodentolepis nana]|uniref:Alkyl transferase n=1 Tax=Rodentolepis nana TaxID=102285 RepID=A0A0R3TMC1_RODNA|nr:unnamed protein product [Rodentolepis nana]
MPLVNEEYKYSCFQNLALNVLKQGIIPFHVAFIMDGNRRYATSRGLQKTEGHSQGFSKLSEVTTYFTYSFKVLRWCYDFGIKEVSVYAFSIENFKRAENEVSFLMDLALEKLNELAQHKEDLDKQGIRVRILGNIRMLPKRLQRVAAQIMLMTRENTRQVNCLLRKDFLKILVPSSSFDFRATLNIMMPYTTRDELTSALDNIRRGVQSGYLHEDDISPEVIDRSSILRDCRPLDLLVRTSGEVRLSDFMLWQASRAASTFSFLTVHWPALSFWHLVVALLQFQLNRAALLPLPECARCHLNRSNSEAITVNGHNGKQYPIVIDVNEMKERKHRLEAFYRMLEHVYYDELIEMSNFPEDAADE